MEQNAKKYQKEKNDDSQSPGSTTLRAIEGGKNRQQQEERDVNPHVNPTNPRNFKRPSHGSTYNASQGAPTGICHARHT